MSRRDLRQHMTDFYGGQSVPSDTADRLAKLAALDGERAGADVVYRYPGRWLLGLVGAAASVALALSAAAYVSVQRSSAPRDTLFASRGTSGDIPQIGVAHSGGDVPRLVAVKFHIDGCPQAARIEPIFTQLAEKYAEAHVVFARYDMSNALARCLSRNLATGLGINWAYEGAYQSGTILLIDRERKEVLAKVTSEPELPELVRTLDRELH